MDRELTDKVKEIKWRIFMITELLHIILSYIKNCSDKNEFPSRVFSVLETTEEELSKIRILKPSKKTENL